MIEVMVAGAALVHVTRDESSPFRDSWAVHTLCGLVLYPGGGNFQPSPGNGRPCQRCAQVRRAIGVVMPRT